MVLGVNPANTTCAQPFLHQKDNEIIFPKNKLHVLDIEHVQTPDQVKLQEERDKINQNMLYYKSQIEEYMKRVNGLELKLSAMKIKQTSLCTQLESKSCQEIPQSIGN